MEKVAREMVEAVSDWAALTSIERASRSGSSRSGSASSTSTGGFSGGGCG